MYAGGVRKKTTKMHRNTYDHIIALRRSSFMLLRLILISGLGPAPADVAQDKDRRDRQDRKHEQRYRGAERQIAALDADLERPGREHVRLVHRAARYMIMKNGAPTQTLTRITAKRAQFGLPSQFTGAIPMCSKVQLNAL